MVEELKLAIKIDDASIEQSLLKQFANAQKMADKVVLDFRNVNFDDKQIEAKFKEMQKKAGQNPIDLTISDNALDMLGQIDKRLTEIFSIGKGKSFIDSSSITADIRKIENKINELNKKINTSFDTKNKTEAYNQLKKYADAFKDYYNNEEAMASESGTKAAYAYYKAYEEALKKEVAQSKLEKVTVDFDINDKFFDKNRIVSDRIKEYANYKKYGNDNDLLEEISSLKNKLFDFNSAYSQVKEKLGQAAITPEIIKSVERYVELLDKARFLEQLNDPDDNDTIKSHRAMAQVSLDDALFNAQEQSNKYTESLRQQEEQITSTVEAEQKLAEVQKETTSNSVTSDNSQIEELKSDIQEVKTELGDVKDRISSIESNGFENVREDVEKTKESVKELNGELTEMKSNISSTLQESNISSEKKDAFPNTDTKLDEAVTSAKDLDKTLKQVDIPTDSFDKVLEKLDRTKSELVDIVKITKQSVSDKDGKFHDSYTLKDSRGSTEIYGINSKTDKGQILRQNIVSYDVKKDTSNNSKAQAHSAKEEWTNALKTVKEYETAVSKLNNLKASDKGLGIKSNEIAEQEKKIDDMKSSFDAAQTTIISFLTSIDKFNTLPVSSIQEVSNVIKLIQTASEGSAESVAKLEDALRNVEKVNLDNFEKEKNQKINKLSSYTDGTKYTSEFKSRVSDEIAKIQKLQFSNPNDVTILKQIDSEIQEIINDSKLLENKLVKQESHLADIISQMKIYRSENTNMSSSQKSSLNSMISSAEELADSGKVTAEQIEQIKIAFSGLKAEISETGRTGKNFFSQIGNRLTDMNSKFVAQFLSWQDWIMYIRQAAEMVIELNTKITELAKVSEDSVSQIYADFDSYANIAKEMGSTISDTIAATTAWSKNGYNIPDSKELAEVSLLYKNVGDGINIDEANESLVSTLKGFKLEADQAEHIVDVFNKVSNNEPISSSGIGDALQRSAASFNAANTSLEKSVALVTATNSVLQDPEKVGNMWKTVSARIRGAKTELEEAGEDTDGMVESTSKLQALIKGMTGFDIMESDGKTFKDIYDIIIGIGEKWQDLNDIDRASILESLAGKNQSNALAAAISQVDVLKKAYGEATNAEGSAREENSKYQQSVQYSIDQTKAKLEELANDTLNSNFLKGAIDAGGKLIEVLDGIVKSGNAIPALLAAIGAGLSFKNIGKCYVSA